MGKYKDVYARKGEKEGGLVGALDHWNAESASKTPHWGLTERRPEQKKRR